MESDEASERRRGRRDSLLEVAITILLGIGAVAIAWSSYQTSLHGGASIQEYSRAIRTSDSASQQWNEGAQIEIQDQALFLEFAKALQADDLELAGYLQQALMRQELSDAIDWWVEQPEANQPDSPFVEENTAYTIAAYDVAAELDDQAEEEFARGSAYNEKGDKYGLVTTIVALALFLLGVAAVFKRFVIRVVLAGGALVVLVIAAVQLAQLGQFTPLS